MGSPRSRRTLRPELPLGLPAPPRNETDLRGQIRDMVLDEFGVRLCRADNRGKFSARSASTKGLPDLFGPIRRMGGRLLGIETKMPKAAPKAHEARQEQLLGEWERDGALVIRRATSVELVRLQLQLAGLKPVRGVA